MQQESSCFLFVAMRPLLIVATTVSAEHWLCSMGLVVVVCRLGRPTDCKIFPE